MDFFVATIIWGCLWLCRWWSVWARWSNGLSGSSYISWFLYKLTSTHPLLKLPLRVPGVIYYVAVRQCLPASQLCDQNKCMQTNEITIPVWPLWWYQWPHNRTTLLTAVDLYLAHQQKASEKPSIQSSEGHTMQAPCQHEVITQTLWREVAFL